MAIWNILRPFGKFYDHLVHILFNWYIFSSLGIMHQEKSGNAGHKQLRLEQRNQSYTTFMNSPISWSVFFCVHAN
jgi:hypothetical protein